MLRNHEIIVKESQFLKSLIFDKSSLFYSSAKLPIVPPWWAYTGVALLGVPPIGENCDLHTTTKRLLSWLDACV